MNIEYCKFWSQKITTEEFALVRKLRKHQSDRLNPEYFCYVALTLNSLRFELVPTLTFSTENFKLTYVQKYWIIAPNWGIGGLRKCVKCLMTGPNSSQNNFHSPFPTFSFHSTSFVPQPVLEVHYAFTNICTYIPSIDLFGR